jgi:hypothetical protein
VPDVDILITVVCWVIGAVLVLAVWVYVVGPMLGVDEERPPGGG